MSENSNNIYNEDIDNNEDMNMINDANINAFNARKEETVKPKGKVHIADEVIAVIAGTATLEIEGVAGTVAPVTSDISGILGKKNLGKGVKVVVDAGEVEIEISISIKFGEKIHEVSETVQEKVKMAIETMTGLNVRQVNINVIGVKQIKEENEM